MRKNHPLFLAFDPEEDSSIVATHRADERCRQRLRTEHKEEEQERYQASDDDLPEIFWPRPPAKPRRLTARLLVQSSSTPKSILENC